MNADARLSPGSSAGTLALGAAALGISLAGVGAGGSGPPGARAASVDTAARFPHEEHAGLFPLCTGCHGSIGRGDSAAFYPKPESCGTCHDGELEERVEWSGPRLGTTNLRFDHAHHAEETRVESGEEASCESCHTASGATRMAVSSRAVADRCLSCHEHDAREHYLDARCATCHRPLSETRFGRDRIAALPEPAAHDRDDFLTETHGEAARGPDATCRTCHTRERCTSCHVDGASREAVASVPAAPSPMELPRLVARYPTPETHESDEWLGDHGDRASGPACSTCHTRQSCTTCHRDSPPGPVFRLPDRRKIDAPGVDQERRPPASHRVPTFVTEHGGRAAADPDRCTSCHSEASCTDCHAAGMIPAGAPSSSARGSDVPRREIRAVHAGIGGGPLPRENPLSRSPLSGTTDTIHADTTEPDTTRADSIDSRWPGPEIRSEPGGFHPENFMARHSAAAYGNRMECANCHDTGAFCRDCHSQTGMGSSGRVGPGFHDAQPLWLLRHGQAARQSLESCASCHRQTDCIQCHSTTGAFSVSPHGPDFDAERFAERNRQVCLACHLTDPLGGGTGQ